MRQYSTVLTVASKPDQTFDNNDAGKEHTTFVIARHSDSDFSYSIEHNSYGV